MQVTSGSVADVDVLVPSWRPSLEAENKSPATLTSYTYATTQLAFLCERGMPTDVGSIAREHVEASLVHVPDTGSASTAETGYRGLRQFFAWCEAPVGDHRIRELTRDEDVFTGRQARRVHHPVVVADGQHRAVVHPELVIAVRHALRIRRAVRVRDHGRHHRLERDGSAEERSRQGSGRWGRRVGSHRRYDERPHPGFCWVVGRIAPDLRGVVVAHNRHGDTYRDYDHHKGHKDPKSEPHVSLRGHPVDLRLPSPTHPRSGHLNTQGPADPLLIGPSRDRHPSACPTAP